MTSIQEQFEAIGRQHQQESSGATIGDGMKYAAKTTAWLAGLTLLFNSLPFLVPLIAGCLFFFRSCNVSPRIAATPRHSPASIQPERTPNRSPPRSSTLLNAIQAPPQPVARPVVQSSVPEPVQTEPEPQPVEVPQASVQPSHETPAASSNPNDPNFTNEAWIEEQQARQASGTGGFFPDVSSEDEPSRRSRSLLTAEERRSFTQEDYYQRMYGARNLAREAQANALRRRAQVPTTGSGGFMLQFQPTGPSTYDSSGIYETIAGGTFVGTCQMPDQPSKRCKLIIKSIRDGGSSIEASLSLLSGSKRRNYQGFVRGDQLTLIPELRRNESPNGMIATQWYGRTPQRIVLNLGNDGKTLSGQAYRSDERFELVPETRAQNAPKVPTLRRMADQEELTWRLVSRNEKPVTGDHLWQFRQTASRRGEFTWLDDEKVRLTGTYRLASGSSRSISLIVGEGDEK